MTDTIYYRISKWALGEETGSSSKAIARHMLGLEDSWFDYPSDGGDFGRCLGLLTAIPEWEARIPEMAQYSEQWSALVKNWDILTSEYRNKSNITLQMQEILREAEDSDPNLIRLGSGCSIRFHK